MIALVGKAGKLIRGPRFENRSELLDVMGQYLPSQIISLQEGWADLLGHYNEGPEARARGLTYMRYRLSNFTAPKKWECHSILENICLNEHPTYLHCFKGVDRTGFICSLYLVLVDGWDPMDAWHEAHRMGMQKHYRFLWEKAFFKRVEELRNCGTAWRQR